MEIRIICVGKIKTNEIKSLIENYEQKISHFNKIKIIELNESTFKQETQENINKAMLEEASLMQPFLNGSYNIALCIEGQEITSVELAQKIEHVFTNNTSVKALNFIIGGSYGIHDSIKKQAHYKLSFSKMTFPHQLMRVILLEQIYRAFTINKNISYHK